MKGYFNVSVLPAQLIDTLTDRLEHDEAQRDAHHRVAHSEEFSWKKKEGGYFRLLWDLNPPLPPIVVGVE